jgi:CBS domain-containing protein
LLDFAFVKQASTAKTTKSSRATTTKPADWTVAAFMTPQPVTIGRNQTLATAHRMMRDSGVRHLPVLEHGDLVGVLTQRDLYFLETLRGVNLDDDVVDDAMTMETYAVTPDTPVATVAKHMARKRYGCAVVMERGRVAGIFTATDGLRLLSAVVPAGAPVNPTQ